MSINFKLDKDNVAKFYANNIIKTRFFNKSLMWIYLYIIIFLGIVFIITTHRSIKIYVCILGAILCIFVKQISKLFYLYRFPKLFSKKAYTPMFSETEIEINEENIYINNSMEKRYLQFTSITSLNVVDEYLVLILTNSKNILIPLKAFNSLKEQENFFKLLEEKTHKKITTSYPKKLFI